MKKVHNLGLFHLFISECKGKHQEEGFNDKSVHQEEGFNDKSASAYQMYPPFLVL
jgi:hypothetical protein